MNLIASPTPIKPVFETFDKAKEFLASRAPAALATEPHERTSDSYKFLPTLPIVEAAYDRGFRLFDANQNGLYRKTAAKTFDRNSGIHLLRFRTENPKMIEGTFSEVILRNGHAANTTLKTFAGAFRMACSNGLVIPVGDSRMEGFSIRHQGDINFDSVVDGFTASAELSEERMDKIDTWHGLDLGEHRDEVVKGLVKRGVQARWGSWENVPQSESRCARDFLSVRRRADAPSNLWTTFNAVQETLIRGTRSRYSSTGNRVRKIRQCRDLDTQTKINGSLWNAAQEVAEWFKG